MKVTTKRISFVLLCVACALLIALGACMSNAGFIPNSYAISETAPSQHYYFDNLNMGTEEYTLLAKTFYNALDEMNTSGDFKDGVVQYPLDEILTSDQIKAWVVGGNLMIPKAFSAARDSYFYDHPELFYADLYKLTISAGRTNGVYSAFIDCGLEPNCYMDYSSLTSVEAVERAIAEYNNKIDEIIEYAQEEANNNNLGILRDKLLADIVNEYIAKNVSYDFEAYESFLETEQYTKPHIGDAYGALILKECVCRGYSFAYKAVLDKLEIPCIVVSGYSIKRGTDGSSTDKGEAHSWNYVWLTTPTDDAQPATVALSDEKEGVWYAYDVTWNSNRDNKHTYSAMNAFIASRTHSTDPIVSSSNYLMPYPDLTMVNYGNTTIDDEFVHTYTYKIDNSAGKDGLDDYGNPFMEKEEAVSYRGKGVAALLKENIHILYRFYSDDGNGGKYWTSWHDLGAINLIYEGAFDQGNSTVVPIAKNSLYSQYAVVDIGPDLTADGTTNTDVDGPLIKYSEKFTDNAGKDLGEHMLYISETYVNKTYGTYTPAPYIKTSEPTHTSTITINDNMAGANGIAKDAFTFKVTYDEELHIIDPNKPIGISYVSEYGNIYEHSTLVPVSGNDVYVELLDDNRTLMFKFKPSLMYEHNSIIYSFYFDNVGSSKIFNGKMSNKVPNPVHYHFAREYRVCAQRLGGGRLWIECCAQPTLVSNSDLAAMDFKDEDGNSTFSEQARSQMMLVAERANSETENAMLNSINKDFGIKNKDLKASETYDINLQICGKYPTIADGSYVKIALGFPEGYGPQDEGVVFKLYHRKHIEGDKYIIEEVPCVVTQFGIVATVTSFSPYMVAAVDASKVSAAKTVYATIDGKGGTLSKEDGKVRSLNSGDSYTYTFTPDAGYSLYRVMLNGEDVTSSVTAEGKLTLSYDSMLNNNEVVVQYISDEAKARYADGFEIVEPVKVIVATNGDASIAILGKDLPLNTVVPPEINIGLVVGVSIAVAIVVAAIAVVVNLVVKRKKGEQKEA